jgi:hypothetical protein
LPKTMQRPSATAGGRLHLRNGNAGLVVPVLTPR